MHASVIDRLRQRLNEIYGPAGEAWAPRFAELIAAAPPVRQRAAPQWDERDVVLITYGDHVRAPGQRPLRALHQFLLQPPLRRDVQHPPPAALFSRSSDDGFSVVDYQAVDPALGDWDDVRALGRSFGLMFDLVLNHVSQHSRWFQEYLLGREPYVRYFTKSIPARTCPR
jgi:hypothetical protein